MSAPKKLFIVSVEFEMCVYTEDARNAERLAVHHAHEEVDAESATINVREMTKMSPTWHGFIPYVKKNSDNPDEKTVDEQIAAAQKSPP